MVDVAVACENLRKDARERWAVVSDDFEAASAAAAGLNLGVEQLGGIADEQGVTAAYGALKARLVALLKNGATEFDILATTLVQVADTYEREDKEGAHLITEAGGGR